MDQELFFENYLSKNFLNETKASKFKKFNEKRENYEIRSVREITSTAPKKSSLQDK